MLIRIGTRIRLWLRQGQGGEGNGQVMGKNKGKYEMVGKDLRRD